MNIDRAMAVRLQGVDFGALNLLLADRLEKQRKAIESFKLSETDTAFLRGQIAQTRDLLGLADDVKNSLSGENKV